MRILVTGAGGFIGRALVPLLLREGWQVRAHAGRRAIPVAAASAGLETMAGELPSEALSSALVAGVDVVVHLAGLAHVASDPAALRKYNLEATLELARAARRQGVRKFIFLSSTKANYPDHSAYGRIKAETERALLAFAAQAPSPAAAGFEVVCLRPALVYGRDMRGNLRSLLRVLQRPALPVFIGSDRRIGMISVDDMARAIVLAIHHDGLAGQCLEVHDGRAYTLDGLTAAVRGHLGYAMPTVRLPGFALRIAATLAEFLAPLRRTSFSLGTYRAIYEENHAGDETFARLTRFLPEDDFLAQLPTLLRGAQDDKSSRVN